MLFSLALILLAGLALGGLMQKFRLPPLLGMMLAGVALGPHALSLLDPSILSISADLRQIALIVILIRAGLSLDLSDLKKVGRPAVLMCFVPATCELLAVTLLAPSLLGIPLVDAAVLGAVLAAVSPAVVVPRMLRLMEEGYGREKSIPQLIMAGASADDIYVIVLFTSFLGMRQGQGFDAAELLRIPASVALGLAAGVAAGLMLCLLFWAVHMRDTVKILVMMGVAFLLVSLENALKPYVALSGLLGVMALGAVVFKKRGAVARRLTSKYSKIWVGAELILFVLVGAATDIGSLKTAGVPAVILIVCALLFRMAGVFLCMAKTKLTKKERFFSAVAYLPKATVQAAIGGIPLAQGVPSGGIILAVAVLAILITAPVGAIGIDLTYKKLLTRRERS